MAVTERLDKCGSLHSLWIHAVRKREGDLALGQVQQEERLSSSLWLVGSGKRLHKLKQDTRRSVLECVSTLMPGKSVLIFPPQPPEFQDVRADIYLQQDEAYCPSRIYLERKYVFTSPFPSGPFHGKFFTCENNGQHLETSQLSQLGSWGEGEAMGRGHGWSQILTL